LPVFAYKKVMTTNVATSPLEIEDANHQSRVDDTIELLFQDVTQIDPAS
jgi:hypothetical protein